MDTKTNLVQIRMSDEQKRQLQELAAEYRLDVSELVRKLVEFATEERPNLIRPMVAPALEIAAA